MTQPPPFHPSKRKRRRLRRREKRLLIEAQDPHTSPDRLRQLLRFPSFQVRGCVYQNPNINGITWVRGLYFFELGCWSNPCAPWYLSDLRAGGEAIAVRAVQKAALNCYEDRRQPLGIDTSVARRRVSAWLNDWVQHATHSYPLEFFEKLHPGPFGQGAARLLASIPLPADLLLHHERFERLLRWSTKWSGPEARTTKWHWVRSYMDCGINCVGGCRYVVCHHPPQYNDVYDIEGLHLVQGSPGHHYISLWQLLVPWSRIREHRDLWDGLEHFFPNETPAGVLRRFFPLTFI